MNLTLGQVLRWAAGAVAAVAFLVLMTRLAIQPAEIAAGQKAFGPLGLPDILFYLVAAATVAGAAGVALSRNILYSAIGLLMALLGAGSLYVFLAADFLAITQLLVYIGGVLVLILFAVMLTNRITEVKVSNASFGLFGGLMLFLAAAPVLVAVAVVTPFAVQVPAAAQHTTAAIGDGFLTKWLLPFEVASLVLLATLVGAVVIARKEIKAD